MISGTDFGTIVVEPFAVTARCARALALICCVVERPPPFGYAQGRVLLDVTSAPRVALVENKFAAKLGARVPWLQSWVMRGHALRVAEFGAARKGFSGGGGRGGGSRSGGGGGGGSG